MAVAPAWLARVSSALGHFCTAPICWTFCHASGQYGRTRLRDVGGQYDEQARSLRLHRAARRRGSLPRRRCLATGQQEQHTCAHRWRCWAHRVRLSTLPVHPNYNRVFEHRNHSWVGHPSGTMLYGVIFISVHMSQSRSRVTAMTTSWSFYRGVSSAPW